MDRRESTAGASQYDAEYYRTHCGPIPYDRSHRDWLDHFATVADEVISRFNPRTVLDIGCAKGFLVETFRDRGVEAFCFDISEYSIGEVRPDIRPYCWIGTAEDPILQKFDLITCIEVLEHVPESKAAATVQNITSASNVILFSSTPSDFTEPTHVNVKPLIYWLRLFASFSFFPILGFEPAFIAPHAIAFSRTLPPMNDDVLRLYACTKNRWIELSELKDTVHKCEAKIAQFAEEKAWFGNNDLTSYQAELLRKNETAVKGLEEKVKQYCERLIYAEATLTSVLNSRGWKLLNSYRDVRGFCMRLIHRFAARHSQQPTILPALATNPLPTLTPRAPCHDYQTWIAAHEVFPDMECIRERIMAFAYKPTISVVMPVHKPPIGYLQKAIESVRNQWYGNWELCVWDDCSGVPEVIDCLKSYACRDLRIKVGFSSENKGISSASNCALKMATGDFVALLDHDDELSLNALLEVAALLQDQSDADMIYSDEDKLGPDGKRIEPFFKPDWSPEYLLSCMYTCHLSVYRRLILEKLGGFRAEFDGSQDYDLALRVGEDTNRVYHIPKVLYHWRMIPGSAAASAQAKPYAYRAAKRALRDHLKRGRNLGGKVLEAMSPGHYRVKFDVDSKEKVSIVLCAFDEPVELSRCIDSIESLSSYPNYEILIVANQRCVESMQEYLASSQHRVLRLNESQNYSQCLNHGASASTGKYLIFLSANTEVIAEDWISALVEFCQQTEIGVAGAKLLCADRRIEQTGIILGLHGIAGRALYGFTSDTPHYFGTASDVRNYSAIHAACMMTRRDLFESLGGFRSHLSMLYGGVDFCLRAREVGHRVVSTPYALLYHHEAQPCKSPPRSEAEYVVQRWGALLRSDPYYSPNLTLEFPDFSFRAADESRKATLMFSDSAGEARKVSCLSTPAASVESV
jgi:glycosyltransferase involved in cell wall biosynthesis/SAM-dependent methyltransferase